MPGPLRTAIEIGSRVGGAVAGLKTVEDRQARLGRALQTTRRHAAALRGRAAELRSTQQRLGDSTGTLARDFDVVGRRLEKARRRMRQEMRELDTLQRARQGWMGALGATGTVAGGVRMVEALLGPIRPLRGPHVGRPQDGTLGRVGSGQGLLSPPLAVLKRLVGFHPLVRW